MRIEDLQLYNNPRRDIVTWKPHLAINLSGGNEKHGLGIGPRFAGNAVECWWRDTTASPLQDSYLWRPYANCLETAVINAIAATFMNSVADSVDLLLKPLPPLMRGRQPPAGVAEEAKTVWAESGVSGQDRIGDVAAQDGGDTAHACSPHLMAGDAVCTTNKCKKCAVLTI